MITLAHTLTGRVFIGLLAACLPVAKMTSQGDERRATQVMSNSQGAVLSRNPDGSRHRPAIRVTFARLFPQLCERRADDDARLASTRHAGGPGPANPHTISRGFAERADGIRGMGIIAHENGSSTRFLSSGRLDGNFWLTHPQRTAPAVYPNGAVERWRALSASSPDIAGLRQTRRDKAQRLRAGNGRA